MCELCDENGGEMLSCQDCGKLICFDIEGGDDVCQPAFVISSGDLLCRRCGIRWEQEEEQMMEEEAIYGMEASKGSREEDRRSECHKYESC